MAVLPAQLTADPAFFEGVAGLLVLLTLVVHVGLTAAIFVAVGEERSRVWRDRRLGPPWLWMLATLLTGVLGALAWWAIHRSNLGPVPREGGDEPSIRT